VVLKEGKCKVGCVLVCATKLLKTSESFMEDVEGRAIADADAVIVAKSDAWNGCYTVSV